VLAATSAQAAPVYYPSGPQAGVSLATVLSGGWSQCYVGTMSVYIGNAGEAVLNQCTGDYLMMAGRQTGSDTFMALAAALRSDTIVDTGNSSNTHLANGSNWWFSDFWSWGFTQAGDSVVNNQCDVSNSPLSMCLHTVNGAGGYRINNTAGLNGSTAYQKVFFQANGNEVPEPGTLGLLAAGLFAAARLRRKAA
jgi:PEP-CTERM motif